MGGSSPVPTTSSPPLLSAGGALAQLRAQLGLHDSLLSPPPAGRSGGGSVSGVAGGGGSSGMKKAASPLQRQRAVAEAHLAARQEYSGLLNSQVCLKAFRKWKVCARLSAQGYCMHWFRRVLSLHGCCISLHHHSTCLKLELEVDKTSCQVLRQKAAAAAGLDSMTRGLLPGGGGDAAAAAAARSTVTAIDRPLFASAANKEGTAAAAAAAEAAESVRREADAETRVLRQRAWAQGYIIGLDGRPQIAAWPKVRFDRFVASTSPFWVFCTAAGQLDSLGCRFAGHAVWRLAQVMSDDLPRCFSSGPRLPVMLSFRD